MALMFSSSLNFFLVHFIITLQSIIFISSATLTSFTIPLIPPFSPESPFYQENLTEDQQLFNQLVISQTHDYYLNSSPNNIQLPVKNIPLALFVTKLVLGIPAKTQVLLLDTGSTTTWTQCTPCIHCFNQTPVPLFHPNQSSSYHKVPCGRSCAPPYKCEGGVCKYTLNYSSGASSKGNVSIEDFSFGNRHVKLVFGCGEDNRNFSFQGKGVSGIVGLNKFRHSLVNQLLAPNHRLFSYCLTTGLNKSSLLKFGEDAAIRPGSGVGTLPFVKTNISMHYHLSLIDISVGSQRLGFPPGTFRLHSNGSGGCFIDSGTPGTAIDEGPYNRVMAEFDHYFTSHGLRRLRLGAALEFCYNYDPHFKSYIKMTFHFDGAVDYVVDTPNVYFMLPQKRGFCVVLKRGRGRTVIGAWQQVNKRIVYDLTHQMLHFKHQDCARDGH